MIIIHQLLAAVLVIAVAAAVAVVAAEWTRKY